MQIIDKQKVLLNAYSASDMAVADGRLSIANTPIQDLKWKDIDAAIATAYNAGVTGRAVINLDDSGSINYDPNSPVKLVFRNAETGHEQPIVIYASAAPTDTEVAATLKQQLDLYTNVSDWQVDTPNSHPAVAEVLDVDFAGEGSEIYVSSNIAGLSVADGTISLTQPVAPVGAGDAAGLSGYNPATQYDKYEFLVRGTLETNGKSSIVLHRYTIYVDNTILAFATDWDAVVGMTGAASVADLREYSEVS